MFEIYPKNVTISFVHISRYLLAIDVPSEVEEYLQGLLDIKNSRHCKFIQDFIDKRWPVKADYYNAPDNVQVFI